MMMLFSIKNYVCMRQFYSRQLMLGISNSLTNFFLKLGGFCIFSNWMAHVHIIKDLIIIGVSGINHTSSTKILEKKILLLVK